MKEIAVEVDGCRAVAREVRKADLETLVSYWHDSSADYLASLGVDLAKLGTREETYERLAAGLVGGDGRQALTVVADIGGELAAYSNLRVAAPGTACGHLHTLSPDPVARHAVYELFPMVTAVAFEELGVSRLRFEASVGNEGINRYLRSFGLEPQRTHLEHPDGMARPGEFNVYEIAIDGGSDGEPR